MSKRLLTFLLSELKAVRIICKACGGVVELPLSELANRFQSHPSKCRVCATPFLCADTNPFEALGRAFKNFTACAEFIDLEFVLPDDEKPA